MLMLAYMICLVIKGESHARVLQANSHRHASSTYSYGERGNS